MNKNVAIVIAPNWHDYARKYLHELMESLRRQNFDGKTRIFLADNETSAESYSLLRNLAPEAVLVLNKGNDGFAKGCNDAIRAALSEGGFDYVFLVNMDAVVDQDCLCKLVEQGEKDPGSSLIQARIMLYGKNGIVNSLGNDTHFLGFGYCRGYNQKWSDLQDDLKIEIMYPSGAGVLIRVEALKKIGLFDEKLWMYNEDQDLGWRSLLCGYRNILAPDAVVYHKYEFAKSIKQYYYMDRNRMIEILKNYRLGTLLLVFPAFVFMELGLLIFSFKSGWFKEKLKVYKFFLGFANWQYILKERRISQNNRTVRDKDILHLFSGKIWYQELDDWKLRLINPLFNLYWVLIQKIIFW